MFSGLLSLRPSVRCPSVNMYYAWHNISVRSGAISTKIGTNVLYVRRRALLKRFSRLEVKGQRS